MVRRGRLTESSWCMHVQVKVYHIESKSGRSGLGRSAETSHLKRMLDLELHARSHSRFFSPQNLLVCLRRLAASSDCEFTQAPKYRPVPGQPAWSSPDGSTILSSIAHVIILPCCDFAAYADLTPTQTTAMNCTTKTFRARVLNRISNTGSLLAVQRSRSERSAEIVH